MGDFDRTARHRAPNGHFSRAQTARLFLHNLLFLMSTELQQAVSLTPQPAVQSAVLVLVPVGQRCITFLLQPSISCSDTRVMEIFFTFHLFFLQKSQGNGPLNRLLMAAKRKYMDTELPPQESEGKAVECSQ